MMIGEKHIVNLRRREDLMATEITIMFTQYGFGYTDRIKQGDPLPQWIESFCTKAMEELQNHIEEQSYQRRLASHSGSGLSFRLEEQASDPTYIQELQEQANIAARNMQKAVDEAVAQRLIREANPPVVLGDDGLYRANGLPPKPGEPWK